MVEKKVTEKIREQEPAALKASINKLRDELRTLRNAKAAQGSANKLAKIKVVRKNIARTLSILSQKERKTLAGDLHRDSKKRPKFLREKLTRAFRRRLTTHQKNKQILKTQKKALNFPVRKYGLRA